MVETEQSKSENNPEIINLVVINDVDGVKTLLMTGSCKVDDVDGNGMTALHHASYKGLLHMSKLLIEYVCYLI